MDSSKYPIVKCPRCDDISSAARWGKLLLPYDLLGVNSQMVCPKCMKMSFKGELTEVR